MKGTAMPQIPNQFEFMNQTWTIRPAQYKELKDDMGECDAMTNTIKLDPSLPPDVLLQTLVHEIIHVWEITLQLDLPERTVDLLALSLIHFFKTNMPFVKLFDETTNDHTDATE